MPPGYRAAGQQANSCHHNSIRGDLSRAAIGSFKLRPGPDPEGSGSATSASGSDQIQPGGQQSKYIAEQHLSAARIRRVVLERITAVATVQ